MKHKYKTVLFAVTTALMLCAGAEVAQAQDSTFYLHTAGPLCRTITPPTGYHACVEISLLCYDDPEHPDGQYGVYSAYCRSDTDYVCDGMQHRGYAEAPAGQNTAFCLDACAGSSAILNVWYYDETISCTKCTWGQ